MPAYLLFWPIVSGTDTPPGPYTSIYCLNGLQPTSNLPGFQNLSERSSQACSIAWCDTIAITGIIGFSSRTNFLSQKSFKNFKKNSPKPQNYSVEVKSEKNGPYFSINYFIFIIIIKALHVK
jgi:hypothetical protein